jgi:hypothetical protein
VPETFNYPAIDTLILHIDNTKVKAHLLPMQVTIAKTHSNSEDHFFRHWSDWIRMLQNYEVSCTFLWVAAKEAYSTDLRSKLSLTRSTTCSVHPYGSMSTVLFSVLLTD